MPGMKILFSAITLLGISLAFAQQPRSVDIVSVPEGGTLRMYNKNWAVIIGIDRYWRCPPLQYAVKDAMGIREVLVALYGYSPSEIIELYNENATRENLLRVLGDELPAKVGKNDQVLMFFAGHGQTRELGGTEQGFILPIDADVNKLAATAISTIELKEKVADIIPAKHIYFVMDACYSGTIFTRSPTIPPPGPYIQEIASRVAKQALTAGGKDQVVEDGGYKGHSIFTGQFMHALESGNADTNHDGVVTATELAMYVAPEVTNQSRQTPPQTPQFGNLPGSEGGEFLFVRAKVTLEQIKSKLEDLERTIRGVETNVKKSDSAQQVLFRKIETLERDLDDNQSALLRKMKSFEDSLKTIKRHIRRSVSYQVDGRIDAFWHSALIPGWGQFRTGRRTEGLLFSLSELTALSSFVLLNYWYEKEKDSYWEIWRVSAAGNDPALTYQLETKQRQMDNLNRYRKYSAYAAVAIYGLNLCDALLFGAFSPPNKNPKFGAKGRLFLSAEARDEAHFIILKVKI
ncbi:MAG: caspase family protein [bacterium]